MRCIFCKQDSSFSRSREHIVPEALGNRDHILEPGVVCDRCNNYFAVKIEKPIMEYNQMIQLRFAARIESKKGRIPPGKGWSAGSLVDLEAGNGITSMFFHNPGAINRVMNSGKGTLYIPAATDLPKNDRLFSRFLGKMALEYLASRVCSVEGWNDEIVDKIELDHLRNFVRFDRGIKGYWDYSIREIYPPGQQFYESVLSTKPYEVLHEMALLNTENNEMYFVIAIIGVECAINLGGPVLGGYHAYLDENNGESVLDKVDKRLRVRK